MATSEDLVKLGYVVTEEMQETDERPAVYSVTAPGVLVYATEAELLDMVFPDPSAKETVEEKVVAADPVAAIAALNPKTATIAGIINAARS